MATTSTLRIKTPYDLAATGKRHARPQPPQGRDAELVKNLRIQATGIMSPKLARDLMERAADAIERLQQLPLL